MQSGAPSCWTGGPRDLLGILGPQCARLGYVDGEERRALLADVLCIDCRDDAICILHHEEQIEHSNRAALRELHDRRGDTPGELVARKANDVYVDGGRLP